MDAVQTLSVDIETYSDVDLKKAGLYRYVQSPAFEILLIAYGLDGGPVQVVDLTAGEEVPYELYSALFNPNYSKHAFNAAFEWYCLSKGFCLSEKESVDWLRQWRCTMIHSLYCGYPGSLAETGNALGLNEDQKKMAVGKALIKYFCKPCAATRSNGQRTRNFPQHDPQKWDLFKTYNAQDVRTEMEIERRLSAFPVPPKIQEEWETDQRINLRGVAVDMELVEGARAIDALRREELLAEAQTITKLDNPNSGPQLLHWLESNMGESIPDIRKDTVEELLERDNLESDVRRMLEIRQELNKTSNTKYGTLASSVCEDGRVRGLLQFYGANRTGRWAGRIVQPQNLPRTYIKASMLPLARDLVKRKNKGGLELVFGNVSDSLSQLIRTALVAAPGCMLVDADFSAIEARLIAWLAGEEWVLDVFRTHGKIYEAAAAQMFNVPMEKIKKGNPEYEYRQKGKVATLALGYGGGPGAMISQGALRMGLSEKELPDIVNHWRTANPHIVQFWSTVDAAAREAVNMGRRIDLWDGRLVFARECDSFNDFLTIQLPSGRKLYYAKPHMRTDRWGRPSLGYQGLGKNNRWESIETYGGKLAENITQAVARDCLAFAIENLESAGFP
ncbi:MAG: hypothetical protein IJT94_09315, partial [Oscillibacter sp.]|nr:hypothetical protein [Oscillibacter sp.]